jgi:hypothetical protein
MLKRDIEILSKDLEEKSSIDRILDRPDLQGIEGDS